MMRVATFAILATCMCAFSVHAIEETVSVQELVDSPMGDGGDGTHPFANGGGDDGAESTGATGTGYETSIANFPGPKYGLPGYKESHKWESDYDRTSPLVFDHRMYKALIGVTAATAQLKSEAQLVTHWNAAIAANSAPNCPQGNIWFNANSYYEMHKTQTEFNMGGAECELIFKVYITEGVFAGYDTAKHVTGTSPFATIGTKLFAPTGGSQDAAQSTAVFQVGSGLYFPTPQSGAGRTDNTFAPARHMTLVFWMAMATPSEAPNAELFAYGGAQNDNYFRTGFGCTGQSIDSSDTNCYFITAFQAGITKEYFHTYNAENFPVLRSAFGGERWAHVTYMLTTASPGFAGDAAPGCPTNKEAGDANAPSTACNGALFLWLNKQKVNLVDWNDGTSTTYAPAWSGPVKGTNLNNDPVWVNNMPQGTNGIHRRFFVAPLKSLTNSGITNNQLVFDFPWETTYEGGVFMCDMIAIPSGEGGFGVDARRKIATQAFFDIMSETRASAFEIKGLPNHGPYGSTPKNIRL